MNVHRASAIPAPLRKGPSCSRWQRTAPTRTAFAGGLLLLLVLLGALPALGQQDALLGQSGIRYPEGFDVNTVGEVSGRVSGIQVPEQGPVTFTVSSKRETYTVFASPRWYWDDLKVPMREGTDVRVTGSKTLGKDGNLYVVAQELTVLSSGALYSLRAPDGSPLWRGPRLGGGGLRRGAEQPLRGGGGAGHGRR